MAFLIKYRVTWLSVSSLVYVNSTLGSSHDSCRTRPVPVMVPGDSDMSLLPFLDSEPLLMAEPSEDE